MAFIQLGDEWSDLMDQYQSDHQNPINQAFHSVGIPMIAASIPLGLSVVGAPLAVPLFAVGWTCQFVGHAFEGKKPSFVEDKRHLLVGLLWWSRKMGLPLVETRAQA
jgi:uncharacterized membrane protein YGL010W